MPSFEESELSELPSLYNNSDGTIGRYATQKEYFKEINYIAKALGVRVCEVGILTDTVDGELWIMIGGHWRGDIDDWLLTCIEQGLPSEVWLNGWYDDAP